ncbi:YbaN family protein [Sphingorhabdus sp. Alg239-R122]|uniref:YbaN family protein n=1 Tax=Sphingorhabdus sp. Alg239-R122 TaxID=2305989 RepID=UPI0013DAAAB7|nr:YbaN family protein [Sphingorhabdus sp. Alg239-R122]
MARVFFLLSGFLALGLGIAGIALPLLPTVPFMILAAFCFAKSSARLEQWILNHPHFGPSIKEWRDHGAISRKGKWAATTAFLFSIGIGFWMLAWPSNLIPPAVACICGAWIWTRPES